jgi:hypothetical protein
MLHHARRRAFVLALSVIAYAIAAWAVLPGFYDGIAPPQPYRWVSPPPQLRSSNQQPLGGRATIRVGGDGLVNPGTVFTDDGQASISFSAGTFAAPADRSPVSIGIRPSATFPDPGRVRLGGNVYCVTSSSPLAPGRDVLVTLQLPAQVGAPGDVYEYEGDGTWRRRGSAGSADPYSIAARATALGCFATGFPPATSPPEGAGVGGRSLPLVAALAILVVVLAGVPLALVRRRGDEGDVEEQDAG